MVDWSASKSDKFDSTDETLDLHHLEYDYIPAAEAFKLSEEYNIPLHPKYTYCYNDVTINDLNSLIDVILENKSNIHKKTDLLLIWITEKRVLEIIGVPHTVKDGKITIDKDHSYALINTLVNHVPVKEHTIEALNEVSPVEIKNKAPAYIGTRVGRT